MRMMLCAALFYCTLCVVAAAHASSIWLAWDPSNDPGVAGYRIHYGTATRNYTKTVQVEGRLTSKALVDNLEEGKTYFFAVTSYNANGKESPFSYEVSKPPGKNQNQRKPPLARPPRRASSPSSSTHAAAKESPGSDAATNQAPLSRNKIPPLVWVAKTPEGKILPSR